MKKKSLYLLVIIVAAILLLMLGTTKVNADGIMYGDANCDNQVNTTDYANLISYLDGELELTEEGIRNADVNNNGVVNTEDVLLMNGFAVRSKFPNTLPNVPITDYVVYGDANCDGLLNYLDDVAITKYVELHEDTLTAQGIKNADVNNDGRINIEDANLVYEVAKYKLPRQTYGYYYDYPYVPMTDYVNKGDVNCDGYLNNEDLDLLLQYLGLGEEITAQGLKNADINNDEAITSDDYDELENLIESKKKTIVGDLMSCMLSKTYNGEVLTEDDLQLEMRRRISRKCTL